MAQPLWKSVWQVLSKLNIQLPHDPEIPLLSVNPEVLKTGAQTDKYTCIFRMILFQTELNSGVIAKKWKPKYLSTTGDR